MESTLKEEIKNLKQQIYQAESIASVHNAVKNGNEVILKNAPSKETLQSMYDELFTLIGVQEKTKKINPLFEKIHNNKVSESSRVDTDLSGWLERLENKKSEKSYLRKPARAKPPRKSWMPSETPEVAPIPSPRENEMIVDTPSRLRQSKDQKHISTSKKSRTGKLSSSKDQKDPSPVTQSLKRIGEIGGEEHHVPFGVPVWKKRRAKVQLGTEELSEYCQKLLQIFLEHPLSWPFLAPVDVVGLGIPDYLEVIKKPMDLGTIQKKLSDQEYKRIEEFVEDVRLVWRNCKRYNNEALDIHKSAQTLENLFEEKLQPIIVYVENNAPLLRNENLQKSINLLQQHHAKLIKQQQLAQVNQMKPKLPNNVVDASPVIISRIEVPTTAPLLPEETIILAEEVIKLEMKYMKGLIQILSEDSPHLLKSDAPIVEINMGSLDSVTLRRISQYVDDCRADRRARKNQSRRKHRESKIAQASSSTHSNSAGGHGGLRSSGAANSLRGSRSNRNLHSRQTQVNSESQSDNSSSEESDTDSEENAPRRSRHNKSRDSYSNQSRASTNTQNTQSLGNSGFEMGGDETPGLTDFQNSGWIGEDADPLYRSYEPGFDGQVPKSTGGSSGALWEEFPALGNQPQQKKKELFDSKPKKDRSEEKSKREEKRRQSKTSSASSTPANANAQNSANKAYESTVMLPPTGTASTNAYAGVAGATGYGAMNSAMSAMYPGMYSAYGMYGGMYNMGAGMTSPGVAGSTGALGATGTTGVGANKQPTLTAYQQQQYQQYYQQAAYAYQQQYYQQQQQYYQAAGLMAAGAIPQVAGLPGATVPGATTTGLPGAITGTTATALPQQVVNAQPTQNATAGAVFPGSVTTQVANPSPVPQNGAGVGVSPTSPVPQNGSTQQAQSTPVQQ